jgi:hypothetical protein
MRVFKEIYNSMTGRIEKDLVFLSEPTVEGLRFAKLFLGDETLAQELVERTLLRLTIFRDGQRSCAKFFGELENLCLEEKNKRSSYKEKQLELFTFEPSGQVQNENKKDMRVARAQALLCGEDRTIVESWQKKPTIANKCFRELVIGFSIRLREESLAVENSTPISTGIERQQEIADYLLGFLADNKAMDVARKCRLDHDWQKEKITMGEVIGWMEYAIQFFDASVDPGEIILNDDGKKRVLGKWELSNHEEILIEGTGELVAEQQGIPTQSNGSSNVQQKGKTRMVFLCTGFFASLIGYFGWMEKLESIPQLISEKKDQLIVSGQLVHLLNDDNWTQFAQFAANEKANLILEDRLVNEIEKMESQITINPSLLTPKGSDIDITNPPNFTKHIDPTLRQANFPKLEVLKTVIDMPEGYIFLPGKENLGKVINIVIKNGLIEFQRVDRPNLNKSFALAVNDYELRIGSISQGFIIILGKVSRLELEKEAVSRLKRYQLIPKDAWWLDTNQSRQRLELDQLSK